MYLANPKKSRDIILPADSLYAKTSYGFPPVITNVITNAFNNHTETETELGRFKMDRSVHMIIF